MSVRKSISSAYFSMTALVLVASILAMGFLQMYLSMEYFKNDKKQTLADISAVAAARAAQESGGLAIWASAEPLLRMQSSISLIAQSSGNLVFAADTVGDVVLCSEGDTCAHTGTVSDKILRQIRQNGSYFELGTLGGVCSQRYYTYARPLYDADSQLVGYVFASADSAAMGVFVSDMFSSFVLSAGLMLLVASVLSILLTSRLTTPLRRIAAAARKFGSGDFSVRVPVEGDDEVAQLAQTFNNMARSLETIDSSRSSFMGNIAHELRTPMTTIKGFIDGILDGTIPPELQNHYLQLVSQETGRLARLVQNMLDLSKLESGEYQVNARMFNIWETLTGVALSAEQRINDGQIDLEGLTMDERVLVYADPDLIHQVVYNLLDNAIKFTPPGGIIRFSVEKLGPEAEIAIWNSGQGISSDALPFVFDRFYKEDKSRGLHARGAGLGLHICKVLVNLSGGQIRVESKQGEWCRFVFTLPVEVPGRGDLLKLSDDTTQEGPDGRPG